MGGRALSTHPCLLCIDKHEGTIQGRANDAAALVCAGLHDPELLVRGQQGLHGRRHQVPARRGPAFRQRERVSRSRGRLDGRRREQSSAPRELSPRESSAPARAQRRAPLWRALHAGAPRPAAPTRHDPSCSSHHAASSRRTWTSTACSAAATRRAWRAARSASRCAPPSGIAILMRYSDGVSNALRDCDINEAP